MNKFHKSIFTITAVLAGLLPITSSADTFHLTDGTILKGRIVMEKADEYVLKVEVSENILSEKRVKKAMIEKIVKDDKSNKAYKKIKSFFPLPDYLTARDYQILEKEYLQKFRSEYPNSKHLKEINKISEDLKAELAHIESGGIKLRGQKIAASEYVDNKFEYDSLLELRDLQLAVQNNQYTQAMQSFEKLEDNYSHTPAFRAGVASVLEFLPKYKASVSKIVDNVETEAERRDRALDTLSDADKKRTERLLQQEADNYERALEYAEKELKTKWLPLNKFHKESATKVLSNISSEENRLANLRYKAEKDASLYYRNFTAAIKANDLEQASKSLNDFRSTRPGNDYINTMKETLKTNKAAAKAEQVRLKEEKRLAEEEKRRLEKEEKENKNKDPNKKEKKAKEKANS